MPFIALFFSSTAVVVIINWNVFSLGKNGIATEVEFAMKSSNFLKCLPS